MPRTRCYLDAYAQKDRPVPALVPVVLGAQGVVIGKEDDVAAGFARGLHQLRDRRRPIRVVRVEMNDARQIVEPRGLAGHGRIGHRLAG